MGVDFKVPLQCEVSSWTKLQVIRYTDMFAIFSQTETLTDIKFDFMITARC